MSGNIQGLMILIDKGPQGIVGDNWGSLGNSLVLLGDNWDSLECS
jgi:hypothetical protein